MFEFFRRQFSSRDAKDALAFGETVADFRLFLKETIGIPEDVVDGLSDSQILDIRNGVKETIDRMAQGEDMSVIGIEIGKDGVRVLREGDMDDSERSGFNIMQHQRLTMESGRLAVQTVWPIILYFMQMELDKRTAGTGAYLDRDLYLSVVNSFIWQICHRTLRTFEEDFQPDPETLQKIENPASIMLMAMSFLVSVSMSGEFLKGCVHYRRKQKGYEGADKALKESLDSPAIKVAKEILEVAIESGGWRSMFSTGQMTNNDDSITKGAERGRLDRESIFIGDALKDPQVPHSHDSVLIRHHVGWLKSLLEKSKTMDEEDREAIKEHFEKYSPMLDEFSETYKEVLSRFKVLMNESGEKADAIIEKVKKKRRKADFERTMGGPGTGVSTGGLVDDAKDAQSIEDILGSIGKEDEDS